MDSPPGRRRARATWTRCSVLAASLQPVTATAPRAGPGLPHPACSVAPGTGPPRVAVAGAGLTGRGRPT